MTEVPRYFLTAYGLALKHGFQGSEQEWLESITAYGIGVSQGYAGSFQDWVAKLNDPVPKFTVGSTKTIAAGFDAKVYITGTKESPILHFEIPRGEGLEDALMVTGGELIGPLSMGGQPLTNVPDPKSDMDAVNKQYVDKSLDETGKAIAAAKKIADAALPASGGSVTGPIAMSNNVISGLPDPTGPSQAATKSYVDTRKKTAVCILAQTGWQNGAQTVAAAGVTASNTVIVAPAPDSFSNYRNWGVRCTGQGNGTLTFAYEFTPTADLTVNVLILE